MHVPDAYIMLFSDYKKCQFLFYYTSKSFSIIHPPGARHSVHFVSSRCFYGPSVLYSSSMECLAYVLNAIGSTIIAENKK